RRDPLVTGVQTCALPIWNEACRAGGSRVVLALAGREIECVRGDGSQQAREAGWERLALAAADSGDGADAALQQASSLADRNAQEIGSASARGRTPGRGGR